MVRNVSPPGKSGEPRFGGQTLRNVATKCGGYLLRLGERGYGHVEVGQKGLEDANWTSGHLG